MLLRRVLMSNSTTDIPSTTVPSTTELPDTSYITWAWATPLVILVLIAITLVLVFKLSSHWHAYVVSGLRRRQRRALVPTSIGKLENKLPIPGKLRLLTLNMFMRPWGIADDSNDDFKEDRLRGFCKTYLDDYDVMCFQECFSTLNYRKAWFIKLALKRGFHYFYESPPAPFCSKKFVDGGLLVLSRLPFVEPPSFRPFSEGVGADGLAEKGIIHVCVRAPTSGPETGPIVHIFTTHLQATYTRVDMEAAKVQVHQLGEMREFIDELTDGRRDDHVILCGDLNVDRLSDAHRARAIHGHAGHLTGKAGEELKATLGRRSPGYGATLNRKTVRAAGGGNKPVDTKSVDLKSNAEESNKPEEDEPDDDFIEEHIGGVQGATVPNPASKMAALALEKVFGLPTGGADGGSDGEFQELLPAFHSGIHPATFVADVDKVTGDFKGSNLHHYMTPEEYEKEHLATRNECLDGVFLRRGAGPLRVLSCDVMNFPLLECRFGRVSDHHGLATVFAFADHGSDGLQEEVNN